MNKNPEWKKSPEISKNSTTRRLSLAVEVGDCFMVKAMIATEKWPENVKGAVSDVTSVAIRLQTVSFVRWTPYLSLFIASVKEKNTWTRTDRRKMLEIREKDEQTLKNANWLWKKQKDTEKCREALKNTKRHWKIQKDTGKYRKTLKNAEDNKKTL